MTTSMHAARGFTLIEALVTLFLISIGVLGMVALQGRAIQYTQDSVQRNTAAMLANDLVELMRAKPDGLPAASGFYKNQEADFPAKPASCAPMPDAAADQLACWAHQSVISALPGADDLLTDEYFVCRTDVPGACNGDGDTVEIQLAWRVKSGECLDAGAGDDEDTDDTVCRYRLMTRVF